MPTVHEQLSAQFYRWELRGRGWQVFSVPVAPEPPFLPFSGYALTREPSVDDGRRPTMLSSFVQRLQQRLRTEPPPVPEPPAEIEETEPEMLIRDPLVELHTALPSTLNISRESFDQFLSNLALCREPIGFELLGTSESIAVQFPVHPQDEPLVRRQLQTHFPDATFVPKQDTLSTAWNELDEAEIVVVEFGLAREFLRPLATNKLDPFIGLTGALAELQSGELGLFQVLFQPVQNPWAESIVCAVTDADGKPIFVNSPELLKACNEKVSRPLYGTVVRIAARGHDYDRAWRIAIDMTAALRVFSHPNGNELIPLTNDDYPHVEHAEDVLRRQSRRSGMLLTIDELIGFVHLPTSTVRSPKLQRIVVKTKAAPKAALAPEGLLLGHNLHAGKSLPVRITPDQRVRHMHVIGASGTGKSTFLFNLIRQDIENGQGVAVLDPHGDLVDQILGIIPQERIGDVVLVDPSDAEYSIGFNILSAHSDMEKNLLASDLVSVFERLSTSWGDQMASVLHNGILAFLESSRGGTLADLRRFLLEPAYRAEFLKTVQDPEIIYYWQKGFPQLAGNKSIGPILTRLGTFLTPKPIRCMVSQKENRLDFAQIMDGGKIFLAKLAQGALGKENSYLLGTLLVAKLQQTAMSRQQVSEAERHDFWLYIDEFHNFITPSMAEILTGVRKYRLGLVLAHQELRQLHRSEDVASAVLSTPYTRVVFRVGDADARELERTLSFFESHDLQNLPNFEAVVRIERSDLDFNLSSPMSPKVDETTAAQRRKQVIDASRAKYGVPRAQIEAALRDVREADGSPPATEPQPKPKRKSSGETPPKETPAVAEPASSPSQVVTPPAPQQPKLSEKKSAEMGIGGNQHHIIDDRITKTAQDLGYRVTLEAKIAGTNRKIDMLLEREDQTIACEIPITNTVDYEVGNIDKCLKAGFRHIAMIGDPKKLQAIERAAKTSLGATDASCVRYFLPDDFLQWLKENPVPKKEPQAPSPSQPVKRLGYNVTRSYPTKTLSPEERKARDKEKFKVMADALRRNLK